MRTCNNVSRYLKELEVLEAESLARIVLKAKEDARRVLGATNKPFRSMPEVDAWRLQYHVMQHRYKFLVLDGPTRLGKSLYAKHLTPAGKEFFLSNCAAGNNPDLKQFKYGIHGLILFDEASCEMVLRERLLFQGSAEEVQLGTSSTNCHSYSVFLHRILIVLASNNWSQELQQVSVSDRDWLNNNSVLINVTTPLWEP